MARSSASNRKIRLQPVGSKWLIATERACWFVACALLGLYVAIRTDAAVNGSADLANITAANITAGAQRDSRDSSVTPLTSAPLPISASSSAWGTLEIPSLQLRTTLYPDTSEVHLNRGAGLIPGMAQPGNGGNLGVAAHRDGTFRPLENIEVGAAIEVHTASHRYVYHVTSIAVVDRTDTALLQRTDESVITLVTCYPFRFVGPAPRRFVVRGLLGSAREAATLVTPRVNTAAI